MKKERDQTVKGGARENLLKAGSNLDARAAMKSGGGAAGSPADTSAMARGTNAVPTGVSE
jgi:hypothetical protein